MSTEETKVLQVTNRYGLHARASTRLAQLAQKYRASITLAREHSDQEVDAKSVLSILSLGAENGEFVRVKASGEDAEKAVKALAELFVNKFHED